jgi:hypothetical protein
MENIKSLEKLTKNKDGSFDVYTKVVSDTITGPVFEFKCDKKHAMRIDLVCYDIYGNTRYIDILTNINSIINPLTINEGDIIYFMDDNEMEDARTSETAINAVLNAIQNANNKGTKKDKARVDDLNKRKNVEEKKKLPPHILINPTDTEEYQEGKVILKPNF